MAQPPELTDRTALARNRARALRAPAFFLLEEAVADLQQRLSEINRSFSSIAIVTPFPAPWQAAFPNARIVPDADVLALDPGAQDLVIHALCLHWANDPVGQLVQCRRALQPDGLFLGVMFGGQTLCELRVALAEAEAQLTGGLSPRVLPMAEIRDLGGLLQRAGFALPVADGIDHAVSYRDLTHLMADLRAMGEGNALAARLRHPTSRRLFALANSLYSSSFAMSDGRIRATFEMIFLTGWVAHESQQKPLRPGSAVQRLSEALQATEHPLPAKGDKTPD